MSSLSPEEVGQRYLEEFRKPPTRVGHLQAFARTRGFKLSYRDAKPLLKSIQEEWGRTGAAMLPTVAPRIEEDTLRITVDYVDEEARAPRLLSRKWKRSDVTAALRACVEKEMSGTLKVRMLFNGVEMTDENTLESCMYTIFVWINPFID